jgi:hypothetical protein
MLSFLAGLLLGLLLGWLTLGCLVNVEVRDLVGWIVGVVAIILAGTLCALGFGLVVWTSAHLALGAPFRSLNPVPGWIEIAHPSEAYGYGAGLLLGGILGLIFTFVLGKISASERQRSKDAADGAVRSGAEKESGTP